MTLCKVHVSFIKLTLHIILWEGMNRTWRRGNSHISIKGGGGGWVIVIFLGVKIHGLVPLRKNIRVILIALI